MSEQRAAHNKAKAAQLRIGGMIGLLNEAGGTPEEFGQVWVNGGKKPAAAIKRRWPSLDLENREITDLARAFDLPAAATMAGRPRPAQVTSLTPWFDRVEALETALGALLKEWQEFKGREED